MSNNINIRDVPKIEEKWIQENQSPEGDECFEENQIKFVNFSIENDIDLDNFLSQKFEGLNEYDNLIENNYEENKNEENEEIQQIEEMNKNEEKENKKNEHASEEIFEIIKKAWGDKTLKFKKSPFKRLLKPKQFSLDGRILLNLSRE